MLNEQELQKMELEIKKKSAEEQKMLSMLVELRKKMVHSFEIHILEDMLASAFSNH